MRAIVCGGRDYDDQDHVFCALDSLLSDGLCCVIEGGQAGADRLAREWAISRGIPYVTFDAEWTRYGKPAGPIRNRRMIVEGKPDVLAAFPGGHGTGNMIQQAETAGIRVLRFQRHRRRA